MILVIPWIEVRKDFQNIVIIPKSASAVSDHNDDSSHIHLSILIKISFQAQLSWLFQDDFQLL